MQEQCEFLKMASVLPPEILLKIVGKLSLKDKFKTLSISTKWNNASSMLLELQTGLYITYNINEGVFRVCNQETHRIDYKGWLPLSLLKNETSLDAALTKMPNVKAVAGLNVKFDECYKFIQSVMKNGIEIECLAGFSDTINVSSLKHFFGEVDYGSLRHLVKQNKDLELLMVSETRFLGDNFIENMIHLEKLHTLHMNLYMGSHVFKEDLLEFITKWNKLNRGHLNIVLEQHENIETDAVRRRIAAISNVNVRLIQVPRSFLLQRNIEEPRFTDHFSFRSDGNCVCRRRHYTCLIQ